MKVKIRRKNLNKFFWDKGLHIRLKGGAEEFIIEGEIIDESFICRTEGCAGTTQSKGLNKRRPKCRSCRKKIKRENKKREPIYMGIGGTCNKCGNSYCYCPERQLDGSWKELPIEEMQDCNNIDMTNKLNEVIRSINKKLYG